MEKNKHYKRLQNVWKGICNRCYNKKAENYCRYGNKGVGICPEWRHTSGPFIDWALQNGYEPGLSIDRIDNNKGYSPDNCRFVSNHVQNCNKSKRADNSSGYIGVYLDKSKGLYRSSIQVNGRRYWFNYFNTAEDALRARNDFITKNGLIEYTVQEV